METDSEFLATSDIIQAIFSGQS